MNEQQIKEAMIENLQLLEFIKSKNHNCPDHTISCLISMLANVILQANQIDDRNIDKIVDHLADIIKQARKLKQETMREQDATKH